MHKESLGKYAAAIYRNSQSIIGHKLSGLELKSGQYDFLYYISKHEGITQQELSDGLYISKSTTAKAVKNLLNSGYIRKEPDIYDKRCNRLYLSKKGLEIEPLVRTAFLEMIDIYAKDISLEEYDHTIFLLKKVLYNLCDEKNKLDTDF